MSSNGGRLNGNWPFSRHISFASRSTKRTKRTSLLSRFDRSRRERKDRLCQLVLKLAPRSSHPNAAISVARFIHKNSWEKNKRKRREEDNKILSIVSRSLEKYQAWKIEKRKRSFRYHLLLPREDEN